MSADLAALVPVTKFETEKAAALVQLGFPAVEPVIPQILELLQDPNWPVASVFKPFLAGIGHPLAPYIRPLLHQPKHHEWHIPFHHVVMSFFTDPEQLASVCELNRSRGSRSGGVDCCSIQRSCQRCAAGQSASLFTGAGP